MVTLDQKIINGFDCIEQDSFWSVFTEYGSAIRIGKNKEGLEIHLASTNSENKKNHKNFLNAVGCADTFCFDSIVRVHSDFLYGEKLKGQEEELRDKLIEFGNVRTEYHSLFLADIIEPTHIDLIVQNTGFEDYSKTVKQFLQFNNWKAVLSTVDNKPNYIIQTTQLVERIEDLLGEELDLGHLSRTIEGYVKGFTPFRSLFNSRSTYSLAITQKDFCPFTFNSEMGELAEKITRGLNNHLEKSKALFNWMRWNIFYDGKQRERMSKKEPHLYRGALQTFQDEKGVCGEKSFLYITLCRLVGIRANYVIIPKEELVRIEKASPEFDHACAILFFPGGKSILVDPDRNNGFDIKYQEFDVCSDNDISIGHFCY